MSGMSFEQIRELVRAALIAQGGENSYYYIVDLYSDAVVYEQGEKFFQCSFSIVDGNVTLGEAKQVQKKIEYIPLQAAGGQFLAAVGDPAAGDDYGYTWQIQICKYGLAQGRPINWPREALVAAIGKYEGARVFCLMDTQHVTEKDRSCGKSVREIVGWVENVRESAAQDALIGDFQILKSAKFLRDMVVDSFTRGKTDLIGFSHDVSAKAITKMVAGKKVKEPVEIVGVEIDVVYSPTNEGKFLQMQAATSGGEETERMYLEKLLAALKRKRPDLYAQNQARIDAGTITETEVEDLLAAAPAGGGEALTVEQVRTMIAEGLQAAGGNQQETLNEIRLQASRTMVAGTLANCGLPAPVVTKLQKRFNDQVVTEEALQAAIKEEKEVIDQLTASGTVHGAGDVRVTVDSVEKLQAGFDGMFGVRVADNTRDIPAFTSLRAAYVQMTGDTDVNGVLAPQQLRRMQAAYGDTTFAYVLGNTLYRRIVQDYREIGDYGVSRLVGPNIRRANDFRPLESIKVGYYGDLPDVDTDNEDYPDLGEVSDEKVEYALNEKGGVITINRRTIINDDVRVIQKIVQRLPRAARRTLAKRVWAPFITNGTYKGDNKAIFHIDHGNLGSAAYSIVAAEAARTAMFKQTEPGSGEVIGLRPATVAFPSDLRSLVTNVNEFRPQAVAVESGNSMFNYFKQEGLFENPFQTDTNNWFMFADPNEIEIVELAFLNGQQEPLMVVADNPANGQMFVGGRIQYRITHDYECEVTDFRGAYGAIVA